MTPSDHYFKFMHQMFDNKLMETVFSIHREKMLPTLDGPQNAEKAYYICKNALLCDLTTKQKKQFTQFEQTFQDVTQYLIPTCFSRGVYAGLKLNFLEELAFQVLIQDEILNPLTVIDNPSAPLNCHSVYRRQLTKLSQIYADMKAQLDGMCWQLFHALMLLWRISLHDTSCECFSYGYTYAERLSHNINDPTKL